MRAGSNRGSKSSPSRPPNPSLDHLMAHGSPDRLALDFRWLPKGPTELWLRRGSLKSLCRVPIRWGRLWPARHLLARISRPKLGAPFSAL